MLQFQLTYNIFLSSTDVMYGDNTLTGAAAEVNKIQQMLDSTNHFLKLNKSQSNGCDDHPLIVVRCFITLFADNVNTSLQI